MRKELILNIYYEFNGANFNLLQKVVEVGYDNIFKSKIQRNSDISYLKMTLFAVWWNLNLTGNWARHFATVWIFFISFRNGSSLECLRASVWNGACIVKIAFIITGTAPHSKLEWMSRNRKEFKVNAKTSIAF